MTTPETLTPWTPPSPLPEQWRTPRLVLRWWQQSDAPALFEAISADRATFLPWLPWVNAEHQALHETVFSIEKMKRERAAPGTTDFTVAIIDGATGAVVGGTGLHRIQAAHHEAEVGYWVRAPLRGRGLCTEATAGMLSWAFTPQSSGGWGFHRVHIRCAGSNGASARVPEKLGLRKEACLVKERWVKDAGWEDTLVWGVLADEWDVGKSKLNAREPR